MRYSSIIIVGMPAQRHRTPPGYQWVQIWPTKTLLGRRLSGGALLAGAMVSCAEHWLPIANAAAAGTLGLALVVGSTQTPRPTVRTDSNGRSKLRPSIFKNHNFHGIALFECAGVLVIWNGIAGQAPLWFASAGGSIVVVLTPILCLPFVMRSQKYLVFGDDELRVVHICKNRVLDRRYPWASIDGIELRAEQPSRASVPLVNFQCPHQAVIEHSTVDRWDYLRDGQNRWQIPIEWWNVEANAFLATLRYFAADPATARDTTPSDLRRMLTPPNWIHRHRAPRPLPTGR